MGNFFSNKLKHFDILNHEWKKLENEIKKTKKSLIKRYVQYVEKAILQYYSKKKD